MNRPTTNDPSPRSRAFCVTKACRGVSAHSAFRMAVGYLRWRIWLPMRRFFRPTFRRPEPRRRVAILILQSKRWHLPRKHERNRHYRDEERDLARVAGNCQTIYLGLINV